jgi:hypothetical protein
MSTKEPVDTCTSVNAGVTTTVSDAVVQLAGVFLSHKWYGRLYVPAGTAVVVETAPVEGVSVMPVGQVPTLATVALPDVPSVADAPFTVSLAATLAMGFDAIPASAVPLSGTATIEALMTVTVSVAVAQPRGVFLSHTRYWMLYAPAGTAIVVLTAPVEGMSAMPVGQVPTLATVALPDVPSVADAPFTVSLAATLAMGLDAVPASALPLSGTALMD